MTTQTQELEYDLTFRAKNNLVYKAVRDFIGPISYRQEVDSAGIFYQYLDQEGRSVIRHDPKTRTFEFSKDVNNFVRLRTSKIIRDKNLETGAYFQ